MAFLTQIFQELLHITFAFPLMYCEVMLYLFWPLSKHSIYFHTLCRLFILKHKHTLRYLWQSLLHIWIWNHDQDEWKRWRHNATLRRENAHCYIRTLTDVCSGSLAYFYTCNTRGSYIVTDTITPKTIVFIKSPFDFFLDTCANVNCNQGSCEALSETETRCGCDAGWYGEFCDISKCWLQPYRVDCTVYVPS